VTRVLEAPTLSRRRPALLGCEMMLEVQIILIPCCNVIVVPRASGASVIE
jgi:hypothetical protein